MRIRIFKKGNKYKKKFSLDSEDWITLIMVVAVLIFVGVQLSLRG